MIEVATWRCARRTAAGDVTFGKGRHLAFDEVFFAADRLVGDESFCHQEPVGRDAQGSMVVEPPPTSTLVVAQTEVLLQILVVALDALALMAGAGQLVDRRVLWQGRQGVFARLGIACRPLDEQPLLGALACFAAIAAGMAHPHSRESLSQ